MDGIRAQYSRLTQQNAATAIFLPFLLGTTAVSAIPFWLGKQHEDVLVVVCALVVGVAINVSTGVCSATVFAIGRAGLIGATAIVEAAICLVLAIPLAVEFGFNGLVAAYGGWIALCNMLGVWFLQARIGIPMKSFLRAIAGPFAVAILAAIVALPINLIAAPDNRADAIAPFLLSSTVFCAIYVTLGWRLDYLPRLFPLPRFFRRSHVSQTRAEGRQHGALANEEFGAMCTTAVQPRNPT